MDKKIAGEKTRGRSAAVFNDSIEGGKNEEAREMSEVASKKTAEKVYTLLDKSSDAIITVGADGKIRAINETALLRYKYRREEFIGMPIRHLYSADASGKLPQKVEMAMKYMKYGETTFEAEHRTREGTIIPTEVNTRKVFISGTPTFLVTCREI
jgi:PAS domain S-box-containing protein